MHGENSLCVCGGGAAQAPHGQLMLRNGGEMSNLDIIGGGGDKDEQPDVVNI